ncbi:putative periplasmic lipoprotein [Photobacterium leiognathi]|uniref:hypothetical protein n=1 Tax=Photobacterium leiognathi TaxID=553611 RepID=UPI002982237E|nr:hypothetical protein [Photobacterium leiognathi]
MKLFIIALASLVLTGCASAPKGKLPVDMNQDNNGTIKISRTQPTNLIATVDEVEIIINDMEVTSVPLMRYREVKAKAGDYTYVFYNDNLVTKAKFTLKAGETKYFIANAIFGSNTVMEVTEESFKRCKLNPMCIHDIIKPNKI